VVDLDLEEDRIDVVPAGLERVELGPSEATALEEGLTVLEEVVRPGARVRGRRRNLGLRRDDELRRKGLAILSRHDADLAGRDLRPNRPVSGNDLPGRHLLPAESLHEDAYHARPDQGETFQDKRPDREERERGPKCDCRNAADEVDHVFALRP